VIDLVTIDPGAKTGIAEWSVVWTASAYDPPVGALVAVGTVAIETSDWVPPRRARRVVWERPVLRTAGRVRATPDDLVTLAYRAGLAVALYRTAGTSVDAVTPAQWKGSVPKAIHHRRILGALTATERTIAGDCGPDALDAIGIGLRLLGRL
jgi:hypothetical protein